jgi:SOS-response transcriptional repressor LexA
LTQHLEVNADYFPRDEVFTGGSSETHEYEVVGQVQGGAFRLAVEFAPEERFTVPALRVPGYEGVAVRALRVVGPSVNDLYPDGTFVIVVSAADTDVRSGDKVVVYDRRGELAEATIKEVRVEADGRIGLWPRSTHPDFQEPIYLAADDQEGPEIAYVVIGSTRIEERPPPPITLGRRKRTG